MNSFSIRIVISVILIEKGSFFAKVRKCSHYWGLNYYYFLCHSPTSLETQAKDYLAIICRFEYNFTSILKECYIKKISVVGK